MFRDTLPSSGGYDGADAGRGWALILISQRDWTQLGARIHLAPGATVVLGRAQDGFGTALAMDERMSRYHAEVQVTAEGGLRLRDLGSCNGTLVNGEPAPATELVDGDVIGLGRTLVLVQRAAGRYRARPHEAIVGMGYHHAQLVEQIERVAPHDAAVLLSGETGTGKDLVARVIHEQSGRRGALVTVDCGGFPSQAVAQSELLGSERVDDEAEPRRGLLEQAHGGTLLLDGLEDALPNVQAILQRFLDTRAVRRLGASESVDIDARIITTTRSSLDALVARGVVAKECAARLRGWVIQLLPLRERRDDIPILASHFVHAYTGRDIPLGRRLMLRLVRYGWPGNVRELELVTERTVIEADGMSPIPMSPSLESLLIGDDPPMAESLTMSQRSLGGLVLGDTWFRRGYGDPVELENRRALCLVYQALRERRQQAPGTSMSVQELMTAGWPDERVIERAGANRVYVALTTLRKLGLRELIIRVEDGYLLDPKVAVRFVDVAGER